ncbi:hypothetical protein [Actinoplanes friuliensis]|uniref:Lipoprotein n=1 Tax=Actinoplanes friuliensis DSM 7358 TaxID=1246995 RepID=U5W505_9ACTN|nr:hypothetical protein [Actinoplanes friuliensis]AGZ43026.1 hypothetical protein AFR_23790 [Actinoplanes friuliensis DSM 7358]
MIRILRGAVVLTALLVVGGCGGETAAPEPAASAVADNQAAVCARWKEAQLPFLAGTAPEAKAYTRAMADSYQGKETAGALEIQKAFWTGWADAIRPLVAEATGPELKKALTAQVGELEQRAATGQVDFAQQPVTGSAQELCLKP